MAEDEARSVGWKFGDAEQEILNILLNVNVEVGEPLEVEVVTAEFDQVKGRECDYVGALKNLQREGMITLEGEETLTLTEKGYRHVFGPPKDSAKS